MSSRKRFNDYGSAGKKRDVEAEFSNLSDAQFGPNAWNYFDPSTGELGKRQIDSRTALFNKDKFKKYWGSKIDENKDYIELYHGADVDKDGIEDYIAYNKKQGRVVGFNDKVVIPKGKSKKIYKRDYMNLTDDQRKATPYKIWLEKQPEQEGWANPLKPLPSDKTIIGGLYKFLANFMKYSSLPISIKSAVINRIYKVVKVSLIDKTAPPAIKVGGPKCALFKNQLKEALKEENLVIRFSNDEAVQTLIKVAYNSIYSTDEKTKISSAENLVTYFDSYLNYLNLKFKTQNDYTALDASIRELAYNKALTKYLKAHNIPKNNATLVNMNLSQQDKNEIAGIAQEEYTKLITPKEKKETKKQKWTIDDLAFSLVEPEEYRRRQREREEYIDKINLEADDKAYKQKYGYYPQEDQYYDPYYENDHRPMELEDE